MALWELYAHVHGKARWGDKTPSHLRCVLSIAALFPDARFVHIVRDGRDVACSMRSTWFGRERTVADFAADWNDRLSRFRTDAAQLPERYIVVRYEDLVHDPSGVLGLVCDFIGLPLDPVMLDYYQTAEQRMRELDDLSTGRLYASRADRTGMHALTSLPLVTDRIGRWRKELGEADLRTFEDAAGQMLSAHGYGRFAEPAQRHP